MNDQTTGARLDREMFDVVERLGLRKFCSTTSPQRGSPMTAQGNALGYG
ncbi:hypothetical protein RISK_006464 [Rhodopirellula islandica]|uniref:Uncharacterized protein n=1 Tax=Rhodopirellula islandica TaxID=595434 RepID=A0A0J1B3X1_RHOIS|nr:hypothetical protein RISK_006464 [Rhodopirellula islandica]